MKATHAFALMVALLSAFAAFVVLQDTPDSFIDLTQLQRRRAYWSLTIAVILICDAFAIASLT